MMNLLRSLLILLLFSYPVLSDAQYIFPEKGDLFDDSSIPIVKIQIPQASLDLILDENNLESNEEFLASFEFIRGNDRQTVDSIGFRLRGNTSRQSDKKSFKVSFNTFIRGQKFQGVEKLNLNGEHNDPSIIRSKLCWDFMNYAGIPSPRSNHVLLYINDEFRGIYINVEHIDEEFVNKRFENDEGNLYKCLYPANLIYKGDNPNLYKEVIYGRRAYDLKTNKAEDDYADLAHFIDILNNTYGDDFQCQLEEIFDVENYLRVIAIDILISNWDGPIVNQNNFYLYHDPQKEKFSYIPYDLDNTLGIGWGSVDWANTDIYSWDDSWGNVERPIYEKIMAIEEYRDKVSYYIEKFINEYFNLNNLGPVINSLKNRLSPHRMDDYYAGLDYGWGFDDFWESFDDGIGNHVRNGITEYIDLRNNSALNQIESYDYSPSAYFYKDLKTNSKVHVEIHFYEELEQGREIILNYRENQGTFETLKMNSSNNIDYYGEIEHNNDGIVEYYISSFLNGTGRNWPFCGVIEKTFTLDLEPALVINEFLASNETNVTDPAGEYEDWIELFNISQDTLDLSSYYLSDNPDNPGKWKIPSQELLPEEYLTFFADEDEVQGQNHTNFKLSRNGEYLGIFKKVDDFYFPVDNLVYPVQETDVSYGRLPNGTGAFQTLPYSTFGYRNDGPRNPEKEKDSIIKIYPNPTIADISFQFEGGIAWKYIAITDVAGKQWFNIKNFSGEELNLNLEELGLANGTYIISGQRFDNSVHAYKFILSRNK